MAVQLNVSPSFAFEIKRLSAASVILDLTLSFAKVFRLPSAPDNHLIF